ncbi:MAG: TonB family protein [Paracoccaceae bacterium]
MTASPPLVHALRQPVRAVARAVGKAGAKPLLVRPTELAAAPCPVVPSRDLPATPLAPKIISPKPLGPAAPTPVRRGGPRGAVLVSTALHLGLLGGYAVFAAPARPLLVPDLETAEVALISEAQFLALTAPQPQIVMAAMPALAVPTSTPTLAAMPPADAPQPLVAPASEPVSLSVPAALPIPALPAAEPPPPAPEPLAAAPAAPAPKPKPQKAKAAPAVKDSAKADPTPAKAKPAQKPSAQAAAAPSAPSPSTAGISAGEAKALKADWGAKVRARINRKVALPADSTPGTVKVRLEIAASGKLLAVGIAQSSGQPALDAAALKAVKSAAPFARAPKGLGEPSYSFSLPITFKS